MEVRMSRRKMVSAIVLVVAIGLAGLVSFAGYNAVLKDDDDDENQSASIKQFNTAKVSLQDGLTAAEPHGQPISGKFEADEGRFQLSVYTVKDGKFSEVLVDYVTGKVSKAEPITKGDDFAAAISQSTAMATAKTSLKDAIDRATGEAVGSRAVGAVPSLKDGHPIAIVLLLTGEQFKTVEKSLE
jgi:hypothetical protein